MDDLYKDNSDVAFCVGSLGGTPVLVLHTNGSMLSAKFLAGEFDALRIRCLLDISEDGTLTPTTFVCLNGADILNPLLACDPAPELQVFIDAEKNKQPWLLALQFEVEKEPRTRVFITTDNKTSSIKGPDGLEVLSRWICPM